jgi:hypothetical protein
LKKRPAAYTAGREGCGFRRSRVDCGQFFANGSSPCASSFTSSIRICFVAGDGAVGKDKAVAADRAQRSVELLEELRELNVLDASLTDTARQSLVGHPLGDNATIMDVLVLELSNASMVGRTSV